LPLSAIKPESWTYVSGRIAALEGTLLGAEALDRLAGADSPSAAASALADSPLRTAAAEARTPAEAAGAVDAHYSAARESLRADCPDEAMFGLLELPTAYRRFKERVRAAEATGTIQAGTCWLPDAVGEVPSEHSHAALDLLAAVLSAERPPEAALAADLLLDSARLLESLDLAGQLGSEPVAGHVADEARVRSVLVVWRSRLTAAREGAESALNAWLPRLFLRGELGRDLAAALWESETAAWPGLIEARLCAGLAGEAFGAGEAERLTGWERAAFNWLTARAREFRSTAFGVERAYGHAWALAVEERNVRLALVGRLRGVGPEAIRELLWEPYCS
jgi:hypothetical protein